jgi:hypothetical protein
MAQSDVKIELAAELERARAALGRGVDAMRHDLDVGTRFKASFHEHKGAYIGGATLFGLILSKLPSRKKKVFVEKKSKERIKEAEKAGIWMILLELLFKTFRPALTSLITKQVTAFVKSRGQGRE